MLCGNAVLRSAWGRRGHWGAVAVSSRLDTCKWRSVTCLRILSSMERVVVFSSRHSTPDWGFVFNMTSSRAGILGSGEKEPYLEGLRGLAAWVVVVHHFSLAFLPSIVFTDAIASQHYEWERFFNASPLYLFFDGNFAVSVFFVLSGYVLTRKLIDSYDVRVAMRAMVRRYFRLTPPIAVAVFLSYALLSLGLFPTARVANITGSTMWLATLWNFGPSFSVAFATSFYLVYSQVSSYITVLWSLHFEFLGSLLSIGASSISSRPVVRWLGYCALLVFTIRSYFGAMVLGTVLAEFSSLMDKRLTNSVTSNASLAIDRGAPVLFFVGLYLGLFPQFGSPHATTFLLRSIQGVGIVAVHSIGALAVVAGLRFSSNLREFFSRDFLKGLGRTSFGVYLVHAIVLGSLTSWLFLYAWPKFGYGTSILLACIPSFVLIYFLGKVFASYIDEPSVRLSKVISNLIVRKAAISA